MTLKASTGIRSGLMVTGSMKSILDGGKIKIFAGAVPASPDDAESGTLLTTISLNSTATGLTFESTAAGGVLSKKGSEIWSGVNVAGGVATYFRFVASGDTGASSLTQPRVQGTVGVIAADMNLSSTTLTAGATQTIDNAAFTLPT